eukprot:CAMPEP_0177668318 /NCGR_PEP_ID=MMETSP0447-20121125/22690_1 /TAXON_ID=0 /ORGANISM="Stygamoeba regulata, Strain BSH-02190019" /LENGTH=231 /DNA_ID=CAMNT_0019174803 /DNA_START=60 /DNA_END=751 /DNA_ORIENTATION=-
MQQQLDALADLFDQEVPFQRPVGSSPRPMERSSSGAAAQPTCRLCRALLHPPGKFCTKCGTPVQTEEGDEAARRTTCQSRRKALPTRPPRPEKASPDSDGPQASLGSYSPRTPAAPSPENKTPRALPPPRSHAQAEEVRAEAARTPHGAATATDAADDDVVVWAGELGANALPLLPPDHAPLPPLGRKPLPPVAHARAPPAGAPVPQRRTPAEVPRSKSDGGVRQRVAAPA